MRDATFRPAPVERCDRLTDQWKESAWKPHGNAGGGELFFERASAGYAEVKDARGQRRIGLASPEHIHKMSDSAGSARRNDGDAHRLADSGSQLVIEPRPHSIGVHGGQQALAGAPV